MHDLTIDTGILMIASGISDHGSEDGCRQLLETMRVAGRVRLVLDKGETIEREYGDKMKGQTLGMQFVKQMASESKVNYVTAPKGQRWQPLRKKLSAEHFDPGDQKFVRAAMASHDKTIVTADDDYSNAVMKILKKHAGIEVVTDIPSLTEYCANPCAQHGSDCTCQLKP